MKLDENLRRIAEARFWLSRGYTTAEKVNGLCREIAKHRGQRAAEQLRADMREELRRQRRVA